MKTITYLIKDSFSLTSSYHQKLIMKINSNKSEFIIKRFFLIFLADELDTFILLMF